LLQTNTTPPHPTAAGENDAISIGGQKSERTKSRWQPPAYEVLSEKYSGMNPFTAAHAGAFVHDGSLSALQVLSARLRSGA
jgi:hypothetical protein